MRPFLVAPAALTAAALLAGCGYVGSPQPPLANVPRAVAALTAIQRGMHLVVQFEVPQFTTEAVAIKNPLRLDLRVAPGKDTFTPEDWAAGARQFPQPPDAGGTAVYDVPAAEWQGREVIVGVRVEGFNGKRSPWTFLVVPVTASPAAPAGLRAEVVAEGVHLSWNGSSGHYRVLRRASGETSFSPSADIEQQEWTDLHTEFGKAYTYIVRSVVKTGHHEAESDPPAEAVITPQDIFPPATPAGLRAAASPNSVELAWDRNSEPDMAGYRVYRSTDGGAFAKIADVSGAPAYSDRGADLTKPIRYAVSAYDKSGNESKPSAPVDATAP